MRKMKKMKMRMKRLMQMNYYLKIMIHS